MFIYIFFFSWLVPFLLPYLTCIVIVHYTYMLFEEQEILLTLSSSSLLRTLRMLLHANYYIFLNMSTHTHTHIACIEHI